MAKPLPNLDVPIQNAAGSMTQAWFEYFQSLQSFVNGLAVTGPSFAVLPLTPGSTAYTPTTGVAKTSTVTGFTVNVQTFLMYTATLTTQQMADNFTTIADALTKSATNDTAIQTAVAALNTRITALENKENAVISDLTTRFP